jgi:hypothetical protein
MHSGPIVPKARLCNPGGGRIIPGNTNPSQKIMGKRLGATGFFLPLIFLCAACAPAVKPEPTPTVALGPSPTRTLLPTASPTHTATDTSTPTPDVPLPEYPNILLPGKERLRDIFGAGAQGGMRSGVFSKVGDSLTANEMFLVPFGSGGYDLGEYGYLQEVIDFFSRETARSANSFANDSLTAQTGWRAEHVLDPAKARAPCDAGESPLLCEYRIVRPAVAVIMLGTNDVMAGPGTFRESMSRILDLSLDRGIIPILTTIPELRGKDVGPYNAAIRDLAAQRDIPLIDLHAALARLPNQGVAPDGVHLSWMEPAVFRPQYLQHGMTVRNLLTLQALDAVWKSYPPPVR